MTSFFRMLREFMGPYCASRNMPALSAMPSLIPSAEKNAVKTLNKHATEACHATCMANQCVYNSNVSSHKAWAKHKSAQMLDIVTKFQGFHKMHALLLSVRLCGLSLDARTATTCPPENSELSIVHRGGSMQGCAGCANTAAAVCHNSDTRLTAGKQSF